MRLFKLICFPLVGICVGQTELAIAQTETNSFPPPIAIAREGSGGKITFRGTLQTAPSISGPWQDLLSAVSPFNVQPEETRYYRTRQPDSIFASTSIVNFVVSGPLQTHFELAFAGLPDGIFPPVRKKPYFDGQLALGVNEIPVTLRVRGNSSLQECPFPKLKFKVSKADRTGTPFHDAREVKIGTHCAEGGRGPIGRLRDETAAYREASVYETMTLLGFVSPRMRRARLEYRDVTNELSQANWIVTRNAIILDDVEVVAERMGGRALDDEEIDALKDAHFDEQLILDLRFLHILLGNWDYALSEDGTDLWNTDVIELSPNSYLPVAGDFDLASWVTETFRVNAPRDYRPELPDVDRQALYELEQLQMKVSPARFESAVNRFASRHAAMQAQINAVVIDEPGRTNALQHVTSFFNALESLDR